MSLRKNLLNSHLPPSIKSSGITTNLSNYKKKYTANRNREYTPISWNKYFEKSETVDINGNKFQIYCSGSEGPLLLLLHGGGFSALTWALFSREIRNRVVCQTLSIDLRGHGDTETTDDDDLSVDTFSRDINAIINKVFENKEIPPIIVIGHSMGGAIAVHAASKDMIPSLTGLCVIDVVEGTAVQALTSMQSFLKGRPKLFKSLEYAIEWAYKSGHTRNLESARISMPGQLKNTLNGNVATQDISNNESFEASCDTDTKIIDVQDDNIILEEVESEDHKNDEKFKVPSTSTNNTALTKSYTWRIDLSKTEKHWLGWFQGLSNLFLNQVSAAKLLILANINGLDTELTVGQMQGKFQMQVLARCGHAVQEDVPDQVADILASFMLRNKLTTACGEFIPTLPAC